ALLRAPLGLRRRVDRARERRGLRARLRAAGRGRKARARGARAGAQAVARGTRPRRALAGAGRGRSRDPAAQRALLPARAPAGRARPNARTRSRRGPRRPGPALARGLGDHRGGGPGPPLRARSRRAPQGRAVSAPWLAEPSPDLAGVPTMISLEERQYLRWLTSAAWRDARHVVEIGPWLGGSPLCLAQGARARCERVRHRIHAVDNFVWRPFMAEHAPLDPCAGDSFVAQFRAHVAPFSDLVAVHAASLPDEEIPGDPEARSQRDHGERPAFRWDAREPVEILFVDGAKSWRGMRHLLAAVGPSLATGALLVCQDFKYWGCYWVPMILGRLAERLELAHDLAAGDTVAFHVRLPIGEREIAGLPDDVHAADPCEAFEALERMRAVLRRAGDELGAHALALSRVKFLA